MAAETLGRGLFVTIGSASPALRLTAEQEAIVAHEPASSLVVSAYAGAGKTATLVEHSKRWRHYRGLYLAFNASIRQEAQAKFPKHVEVRTLHSYAYRELGVSAYKERLQAGVIRRKQLREAAEAALGSTEATLLPATVLRRISWGFKRFLISDDPHLTQKHLPPPKQSNPPWEYDRIMRAATRIADHLMNFRHNDGPYNHDIYLKAFALDQRNGLTRPPDVDVILVDEAQDLNPVLIGMIRRFETPLIIVGDTYQSIYAFRGAVSAMNTFEGPQLPLTQSWRFGAAVADAANQILEHTSNPPKQPVRPNPNINTTVQHGVSRDGAILARTNASLMQHLMNGIDRPFHIAGGFHQFRREIQTAIDLWLGNPPRDNFALPYQDRDELELEAKEGGDPVAARLVQLLEGHGPSKLLAALERLAEFAVDQPREGILRLSTAHKAKGLEFETVSLLDDFWSLGRRLSYRHYLQKKGRWTAEKVSDFDQELNLLYVAVTRAQQQLFLPLELFRELQSAGSPVVADVPQAAGVALSARDARRVTIPDHESSLEVKWGGVDGVRAAITSNANLELRDENGRTALAWAAAREEPQLIRELVEAGANIDACSPEERLLIAVVLEDTRELRALIASGADIKERYGQGRRTLLGCAAEYGSSEVLRLLLDAGKQLELRDGQFDYLESWVEAYDSNFETPIYDAVAGGNVENVRLLLDAGAAVADPNLAIAVGNSVLSFAVEGASADIVRLLIDAGANPHEDDDALLHRAAMCNRADNVLVLIRAGMDVDALNRDSCTPLMVAAENGSLASLQILLDEDAWLDARDPSGKTALMFAARAGSEKCLAALLNAGANARARTLEGHTAFDYAADHAHLIGTQAYWALNDARF